MFILTSKYNGCIRMYSSGFVYRSIKSIFTFPPLFFIFHTLLSFLSVKRFSRFVLNVKIFYLDCTLLLCSYFHYCYNYFVRDLVSIRLFPISVLSIPLIFPFLIVDLTYSLQHSNFQSFHDFSFMSCRYIHFTFIFLSRAATQERTQNLYIFHTSRLNIMLTLATSLRLRLIYCD